MIDIHIGVTDAEAAALAVSSLSGRDWIGVHEVTDGTSLYDVRLRGFAMGTNPWVSFVTEGETFLQVPQLRRLLEITPHQALFTNCIVSNAADSTQSLQRLRDFKWDGNNSFKAGIIPNTPLIVKRELAQSALQAAYDRVLKDRPDFLEHVDLALTGEIALSSGWTYDPRILYRRARTDKEVSSTSIMARRELFGLYRDLIVV